jgi:hypothetical protein
MLSGEMARSLRDWCENQRWDCGFELPSRPEATAAEKEELFRQWLREIQESGVAPDFYWARFDTGSDKEPSRIYVLLGGLKAGESLRWARRWGAIQGDPDLSAGLEYRYRGERKPVGSTLKRLLGGKTFTVEVSAGRKASNRSAKQQDKSSSPLPELGAKPRVSAKILRERRFRANWHTIIE